MKCLISFIALALVPCSSQAEEPEPKPEPIPPAVKAFEQAVRDAEKSIHNAKAFSVSVATEWNFSSDNNNNEGTHRMKVVQAGERICVELRAGDAPGAGYTAVCDGKTLTRVCNASKLYSVSPCSNALHDLQTDAVTVPMLHTTGCEFVIAPDIHGAVLAQVVLVDDLGVKKTDSQALHGFDLHLVNGRDVMVYFDTKEPRLPVKVVITTQIPLSEKEKATSVIDSTLTWDLDHNPAKGDFAVEIPEDAKKVESLADELFGFGTAELIGKLVPKITFTDLKGKELTPDGLRGDGALVICFWATWSEPTDEQLRELQMLLDLVKGKDVKFIAPNVGESQEAVQAVADAERYRTQLVRDPKGEALHAFRAAVPSAVVIDHDGKVTAITRGLSPESIGQLREALKKLIKEE